MAIVTGKKMMKMVKQWQKYGALQPKRIHSRTDDRGGSSDSPKASSSTVDRGHFVVYTADQSRFVVPLAYLDDAIFKELLNMSVEEYGLPSNGPITLPCDSVFMDYIIYVIRQGRASDLHEALFKSVASNNIVRWFVKYDSKCKKRGCNDMYDLDRNRSMF